MPSTTNLNTLTINHVESQAVYDQMVSGGLINENELYLIPGDNTYILPIASTSSLGGIKIGNYLTINSATGVMDASGYTLSKPSTRNGYTGIDIKLTGSDGAAGQENYVNIPLASTSVAGLMSAADKTTLNGLAGAEPNQNAFSKIRVYTSESAYTDLDADAKQDTVIIKPGSNVSISPTANTDTFVIAATDTKYSADSTSINKVTSTTPGAAASLTTENLTIYGINYGQNWTLPSLTKSNVTIPNVTNAGSATTASVSAGVLTITTGSAPTLGNSLTATYISNWSAGEIPDITTNTFKAVDSWTTNTPTVVNTATQTVLTKLNVTG